MTPLLILSVMLIAAASGFALHAVALPRIRAQQRIAEVATYSEAAAAPVLATDHASSPLQRFSAGLGLLIAHRVRSIDLQALRRQLLRAGKYNARPETFVGYSAIACVVLTGLGALAGYDTLTRIAFPVVCGLIGAVAPQRLLKVAGDRRTQNIEDGLADLMDLLVVTVEAGLSLTSSLQVAARRMEGPLGDELRLTLQEQRMGLPIASALRNLMQRCETPGIRSFVQSTVQGETLGVSIGTIMRNLSVEMRKRRRARAEERAHKAPVKMLFPLVFLMLPSIFVVLLGAALLNVIDGLGSV